jgi:hypothetical protein
LVSSAIPCDEVVEGQGQETATGDGGREKETAAGTGNSGQPQAAVVRSSGGGMDPSGSFRPGYSRWPAGVKGEPVKPVRSTLDTGCLTGLGKRA